MLSMPQAIQRLKGATAAFVDAPLIHSLCRQLRLGGRRRRLTPLLTTHLFVRQILEGNTSVPELRRLAKFSFADSSYCDARQRLPVPFFQRLSAAVLDRCRRHSDNDPRALWHGHRVFFLEEKGSGLVDLSGDDGCRSSLTMSPDPFSVHALGRRPKGAVEHLAYFEDL